MPPRSFCGAAAGRLYSVLSMGARPRRTSRTVRASLACGFAVCSIPVFGRAGGPASLSEETAALVERERIRPQVESVLADLENNFRSWEQSNAGVLFDRAARALIELGPAVSEYMIAEVERPVFSTFYVAAYVLGRLPSPSGTEALYRALEVAEAEGSGFGRDRKAWLLYCLALQGEADAVNFLAAGLPVAGMELMEGMTLADVLAVLLGPSSVERFGAQLDRLAREEGADRQLELRLIALGHVREESAIDKISAFLNHPSARVRAASVRALGVAPDPAIAGRLLAALEDPDPSVRLRAAAGIFELLPAGSLRTLLGRLELETSPSVRSFLYRAVATIGGETMVEALRNHFGRDSFEDRVGLVDALGDLGSPRGLNLLRAALKDKDVGVVLHALASLERIGTPGAVETLLASLGDPRWPVVETSAEILSRIGEARAAPRIAELLVRRILDKPIVDPSRRDEVVVLGEALVALRYPDPLVRIREASSVQTDPEIRRYLDGLVQRLELLKENKDSVSKWGEALSSPDPRIRSLASRRLADSGQASAARALVAAFDRAPDEEKSDILRALARLGRPEASPLVEKILLDPAYDDLELAPLRAWAAWAARRIGGERLRSALRKSVERRDGQDIYGLTYYALNEGRESLPLLRAVRSKRLRHYSWKRGAEQDRLDWILRRLELGQKLDALDRPPDETPLEPWRVWPH